MHILIVLILTLLLLALGAAFSGMNIGLMMIRPAELKRKAAHGDKIAERLYRYRKNGNYLIVCLLLGNVAVISVLTLLLDSVAGGIVAGIVTTGLVTIFAEIIPQAIFVRLGYRFSRYFFGLLDVVFVLFWPFAKPLSVALNHFLGEELPAIYSREELTHLIEEHARAATSTIDVDESRIISGALGYSTRTATEAMTLIGKAVIVNADDMIDAHLLARLKRSGHSRFPVYDPEQHEYVGILYVKDLLGRHFPLPVAHAYRDRVFEVPHDSRLDTVLSRFIQTKSHLFLVKDNDDKTIGIITIEDVIEEILNREITDEFDQDVS